MMKKTLLLFPFLFLTIIAQGQNFQVLKDSVAKIDAKGEIINPLTYVFNNSNQKMKFRWVKGSSKIPQNWYRPGVGDKNLVYTQRDSATFELNAKDSGQLFVNFYAYDNNFNPKSGEGYLNLIVYPVSKGSSAQKKIFFKGKTAPLIDTSACEDYTVPSGDETYTSSGKYFDTLNMQQNKDSIIIIDLALSEQIQSTVDTTTCNAYTAPSGKKVYSKSGQYKDTIPTSGICDRIITINLTIEDSTVTRIKKASCKQYTVPSGDETYYSSGTFQDTVSNGKICDSILLIDLAINSVDTGVTRFNQTLKSNVGGGIYQWLDCNNNFKAISGETGQSFTPQKPGDYAVKITKNGCTDTSQCYSIQNVGGVLENDFGASLKYYPNPTNGRVKVKLKKRYEAITATVSDLSGKTVDKKTFKGTKRFPIQIEGEKGYYILSIESEKGKKARLKILKK
jgi:hypothetical protein